MNISEEIKAILLAAHESSTHAGRLYASSAGAPCSRQIWYDFHDPIASELKISGILAMEDGNLGEDLMRSRLAKHPDITVTRDQERVYLLDKRISGRIDGVITIDRTKRLWEHKNVNERSFKKLKESVLEWEPKYFAQVQIYMHGLSLRECIFTVATPGGRDFKDLLVAYDEKYTLQLLERLEVIMESMQPLARISEKKDFWICRFCQYNERCHGD